MVSKIAVMALVVIVAVPILLGYGLNIQTDSYYDWEETGTALDVTEYLYNIVDANKRDYTDADLYNFNSRSFYTNETFIYPYYASVTDTKSSIMMNQDYLRLTNGYVVAALTDNYVVIDVTGGYDASNYYTFTITFLDSTTTTISHVETFYWTSDGTSGSLTCASRSPGYGWVTCDNVQRVTVAVTGTAPYVVQQYTSNGTGQFVDISKGYTLNMRYPKATTNTDTSSDTQVQPAGICQNMLLTFNLDSITQPDYWMGIHLVNNQSVIDLTKTTTGGVVSWKYHIRGDSDDHELYYNPDLTSNTYQLFLNADKGGEFRYVGAWSDTIAPAQALITYSFDCDLTALYPYPNYAPPDSLPPFFIKGQTPIMRIDAARVAAYEYRILRDVTYTPSDFVDNPSTKITNIGETGTSLTFGGNTYTVTDGNITIGTKTISIRNMVLDSVPVAGGYENHINGYTVSTTAAPSTIQFSGDWAITVSSISQKLTLKDESKWIPGKFAWQGVDDNFLLAGIFTSLAAFIGLAIYGRRSGAKVLPLMLICGGAAFMFFLMI